MLGKKRREKIAPLQNLVWQLVFWLEFSPSEEDRDVGGEIWQELLGEAGQKGWSEDLHRGASWILYEARRSIRGPLSLGRMSEEDSDRVLRYVMFVIRNIAARDYGGMFAPAFRGKETLPPYHVQCQKVLEHIFLRDTVLWEFCEEEEQAAKRAELPERHPRPPPQRTLDSPFESRVLSFYP